MSVAHFAIGGSLGSCGRIDPNVGGAGACGDATLGLTLLLGTTSTPDPKTYRGWRLGFELGVGANQSTTQGYPDLGLAQSSGGMSALFRALVGYDWTPLFFIQTGAQTRMTSSLSGAMPSADWILELGTRIFTASWELGVRQQVGVDDVASGGRDLTNGWTSAFAYGTTAFTRVLVP
jgi:hypothetical protein